MTLPPHALEAADKAKCDYWQEARPPEGAGDANPDCPECGGEGVVDAAVAGYRYPSAEEPVPLEACSCRTWEAEVPTELMISAFLSACSDRDLAQMGMQRFTDDEMRALLTATLHDDDFLGRLASAKARLRAALGAEQSEDE